MLLFGLGIRHGLPHVPDAQAEQEINAIPGVGPAIAEAAATFFAEPRNRTLIERLGQAGINFTEPQAETAGGPLAGKAYVLTGTLPTLSRSDATSLIEGAGGRVASGVSKKTDAVVAGADAGGKLDKAKSLGVEVIDEPELLRRVGRTA